MDFISQGVVWLRLGSTSLSTSVMACLLQPRQHPTARICDMFQKTLTLLASVLVFSLSAYPCQRVTPVSSVEMVREADLIVRAIAEKYDVAPKSPPVSTGFVPASTVHFH